MKLFLVKKWGKKKKDKAAHTTARKAYEPSSAEWSLPRQSGSSLDSYCQRYQAKIHVHMYYSTYLSIIWPISIGLPGVNGCIGNGVSSEIGYYSFYKHVIALPFWCDRLAFLLWKRRTNQKECSTQGVNQLLLTIMCIFSEERPKDGALSCTRGFGTVDRIDEGRDSKSVR